MHISADYSAIKLFLALFASIIKA